MGSKGARITKNSESSTPTIFDHLLGRDLLEVELMDAVVTKTLQVPDAVKAQCYFIRLQKSDDGQSVKIAWIKAFANPRELSDFNFDTKLDRASLMLKFENGLFRILLKSFYQSNLFFFEESGVVRLTEPDPGYPDIDNSEMPPRDLLMGFKEMGSLLKAS